MRERKMSLSKLGLLPRIVIAIVLGILTGQVLPEGVYFRNDPYSKRDVATYCQEHDIEYIGVMDILTINNGRS